MIRALRDVSFSLRRYQIVLLVDRGTERGAINLPKVSLRSRAPARNRTRVNVNPSPLRHHATPVHGVIISLDLHQSRSTTIVGGALKNTF